MPWYLWGSRHSDAALSTLVGVVSFRTAVTTRLELYEQTVQLERQAPTEVRWSRAPRVSEGAPDEVAVLRRLNDRDGRFPRTGADKAALIWQVDQIGCARCSSTGKVACRRCKGSGATTCSECDGRGEAEYSKDERCDHPTGILGVAIGVHNDENSCTRCNGTGSIKEEYRDTCHRCGGRGEVSCSPTETCSACQGEQYLARVSWRRRIYTARQVGRWAVGTDELLGLVSRKARPTVLQLSSEAGIYESVGLAPAATSIRAAIDAIGVNDPFRLAVATLYTAPVAESVLATAGSERTIVMAMIDGNWQVIRGEPLYRHRHPALVALGVASLVVALVSGGALILGYVR